MIETPLTAAEKQAVKNGYAQVLVCPYCKENAVFAMVTVMSSIISKRKLHCRKYECTEAWGREYPLQ